ncbi:transposase [Actinoplanes sp. SE50]|uniref:transposase n=1 Tax=unclassified Actinoplanes TaxID=2626549 RepID=UPI00023EDDBC|nr:MULTISPECIES: transposase [unclassified Actinoplanes]AEV88638.1 Mini-circle putative transposase for IS117 [Actinoplanes sp. SE50/110]ATO87042.1 transposase [Actinoplanes sp. SE50]SLM04460.1 transposase [Actinoplanes sp. SE50/110]
MALVRVYCGLASADDAVRSATAAPLTIAVVDDAGRLLGVHEISDDPAGYALLGTLLVERTTGFSDAAVAADSDDHVVTSLLTAAGRPLVVVDDDDADDFAERFSDDDSPEEINAPAAARRAVGLARALQAGAIAAVTLPAPRELVSYKPVLAAHVAMLVGRNAAAAALREVLRELYPAALRAYPDPAHPIAMAVLEAIPEPGRLTGRGGDPEHAAQEVAAELTRAGVGSEDQIFSFITALQVAISESPRRGGVNKSLAPAAAEAVRHAIAAVRTCDAGCAALVGTLAARSGGPAAEPNVGRRATRRAAEPAAATPSSELGSRFARRGRSEPAAAGLGRPEPAVAGLGRPEPAGLGNGPATPRPMNAPPVAPDPITPPPVAPAAANGLPGRVSTPGNRPVSVPPPPPGMTPITPGSRPVPGSRTPGLASTSGLAGTSGLSGTSSLSGTSGGLSPAARSPLSPAPSSAPLSPAARNPVSPAARNPVSPGGTPTPAEAGEPFRPTLTNAELNRARAERQRTVIPARPSTRSAAPSPATNGAAAGPTDFALPMPAQRPGAESAEPGSRANWPLLNNGGDDAALPAASVSGAGADGRIRPPWQDMPKEPPALRLVESQLNGGGRAKLPGLDQLGDPPSLRVVDGGARGVDSLPPKVTALDRSSTPPVPSDGSDGDLLIFAAARSAWFTGGTSTGDSGNVDWANPNDSGWRAAEKAATPAVAAETSAGLPKRVPQANLVPGATVRDERPLRIVRDAASIAAHTTGYFRGWRRGQEIGGFAMGGRPGREAAGGWDFTRDREGADEYRNGAGYGGGR